MLTYVLHAKVTDASNANLSSVNCVLDGSLRLKPSLLATVWTMEEEQIDIPKATALYRMRDRLSNSVIRRVGGKFGGVVEILTFKSLRVVFAREKVENCPATLGLITVHLQRIESSRF
jgi:hypothetical protein